jgi:hypothetical protein
LEVGTRVGARVRRVGALVGRGVAIGSRDGVEVAREGFEVGAGVRRVGALVGLEVGLSDGAGDGL